MTIFGQVNTLPREQLKENYKKYNSHTYQPLNFHDWLLANKYNIAVDSKTVSPGIYLVRARKLVTYSYICQILGCGILVYGAEQYRNYGGVNEDGSTFRVVKGTNIRNICLISTGTLWLTGMTLFTLAGNNIGKAGIALDENGVGVKVNF